MKHSDVLQKSSLRLKQKCLLVIYFSLVIFGRIYSSFVSLTLPAINLNLFLQDEVAQNKRDLSNFLSNQFYRLDFNVKRQESLKEVSSQIYVNFYCLLIVQMTHIFVVFVQALLFVPKFKQNKLKSKLIFLLGNMFACLPVQDQQSRSEKVQTIFLLILHNFETVGMFYLCMFISPGLTQVTLHQGFLVLPLVVANVLAVFALLCYYKGRDQILRKKYPHSIALYEEEVSPSFF